MNGFPPTTGNIRRPCAHGEGPRSIWPTVVPGPPLRPGDRRGAAFAGEDGRGSSNNAQDNTHLARAMARRWSSEDRVTWRKEPAHAELDGRRPSEARRFGDCLVVRQQARASNTGTVSTSSVGRQQGTREAHCFPSSPLNSGCNCIPQINWARFHFPCSSADVCKSASDGLEQRKHHALPTLRSYG
jgi:hypothetical protein